MQVEPGDLITFRIGINEDAVEEDDDGVAVIDDVYKKADLEFVAGDAEFDPEDCDPPAVASAPAENKVTCRVTLGPDGNARLYLTFRVLPPSGNPQACVPGTNVVNTDGGSSAAEGGDQASTRSAQRARYPVRARRPKPAAAKMAGACRTRQWAVPRALVRCSPSPF